MAKSSFNIFAVRRAFAYGHSLLAAQEGTGSGTVDGSTVLGSLISFTRPESLEEEPPSKKRKMK